MDEEDEGQVRPMMDPTGNPLASTKSQQAYYEATRPTTEAEEEAAGIRTGSLRRLKMRRFSEDTKARSKT
jgi:hypothetical protein